LVQTDGRLLITGSFREVNGVKRDGFARLHPNGALDSSLQTFTNAVNRILLQPDDKILAAVNDSSRIVRLNPDGTSDPSFHDFSGDYVLPGALQLDGRIIVQCISALSPSRSRSDLVRLYPDGTVDSTVTATASGPIWIQPDGKLLVGLTRLNPDGSRDPSFDPGDAWYRGSADDARLYDTSRGPDGSGF
jgi:uncharacterized delta-60 repeat protein